MQENLNLFDFELDAEDMQEIAGSTPPIVFSSTIVAEKQPGSLWSGELWSKPTE